MQASLFFRASAPNKVSRFRKFLAIGSFGFPTTVSMVFDSPLDAVIVDWNVPKSIPR